MDDAKRKTGDRLRVSRRAFLKTSGLVSAALFAGTLTRRPRVSPSEPVQENPRIITPDEIVATSCLNCSTRCATQVRVANEKAVRIAGNPLSQVSEGEICPRGHIGLQVLYDQERLKGPLKRTNPAKGRGVDPGWQPVSWSGAAGEISARLRSLRDTGQPHRLLLLHGLNSISDEDLIHRFADAYGTPNVIAEDALHKEAEKLGRWMADGRHEHIGYDIGRTGYILAFGAGILEYEKPFARNLRMWGKIRRERANRARVVVVDPRYSVTAAKADRWLPINPGTDGALAMSIAHVIVSEGLYDAGFIENWTSGFDAYRQIVLESRDEQGKPYYHPENVAKITGISADTIWQIARELAQTRPAIAWVGRGATDWPNGAYTSYAIFCLNALVGSIDIPGGIVYQQDPEYRGMPPIAEDAVATDGRSKPRVDRAFMYPAAQAAANEVADSILTGNPYPVEIAVGFNSGFNMSAPGAERWGEALKKVPYYVHVAPVLTEMAEYADLVLPASTFLEAWAYDHSPPGSGFAELKLKQPVVTPLHDTRSVGDIVFELARQLGGTVGQSFSQIGDGAEGFVKYRTGSLVGWSDLRANGVWVGPPYEYRKYDRIFTTPSRKFEFYSSGLEARLKSAGEKTGDKLVFLPHYEAARFLGEKGSYPFALSTYQPALTIESGNQNYPWAQQIFMPMHGVGWTNFAEINSHTARELGIRDGDMVWVESAFGKVRAKARVIEGIHPEVVSIAFGQGHRAGGRWQKGIGVNPNEIIGVDYDRLSGQSSFFNTRVRVYRA